MEGFLEVTRQNEVDSDALAYARLAHAHADRSYRLAGYLLGDRAEAEDALQDALVRAWRSWPELRDQASFGSWFDRIVVNVCRDRLRRHRTLRMVDLGEATGVTAADDFGAMLTGDELGRVVARLSPEHRAVVALRFWHDLTIEDTADRLGIPVGTAKSRLHYALRELRAQMTAEGAGR